MVDHEPPGLLGKSVGEGGGSSKATRQNPQQQGMPTFQGEFQGQALGMLLCKLAKAHAM